MEKIRCRILFLLAAIVPVHAVAADQLKNGSCEFRTSEVYPIRSIQGIPKAGSRVKVEILFERKGEARRQKSQVILTSEGAVCRSPNPALNPEERGWIEIGFGKKLTDLRVVKQIVGFDGFSVTVIPSTDQVTQ